MSLFKSFVMKIHMGHFHCGIGWSVGMEEPDICENLIHRGPEALCAHIKSCVVSCYRSMGQLFTGQPKQWMFDYHIFAGTCEEFCYGVSKRVVAQVSVTKVFFLHLLHL